jgi:hypothetical protein
MRLGQGTLGVAIAAGCIAAIWAGATLWTGKARSLAPEPVAAAAPGPGDMVVYKSPTCGCCDGWIDHVRAAGFRVIPRDTGDVGAVKRRLGVLPTLHSCHTAVIAGYAIEGHVPADAIARLLEERPPIVGLAVPGMPAGSPGMESATPHVHYDVIAFDKEARTSVFARY